MRECPRASCTFTTTHAFSVQHSLTSPAAAGGDDHIIDKHVSHPSVRPRLRPRPRSMSVCVTCSRVAAPRPANDAVTVPCRVGGFPSFFPTFIRPFVTHLAQYGYRRRRDSF